jgi:hypothetical protein
MGDRLNVTRHSPEYHSAHLAFSRSTIVQAAAEGRPILDLLRTYTEDVKTAERDLHRGAVEALDTLADAVRDTLCDEESCGRCRVLRDALPAKTSGLVPEHPGARGASLTGVTVPPNAARPSPNPRAVVRRPGASTPHEHEEA